MYLSKNRIRSQINEDVTFLPFMIDVSLQQYTKSNL